MGADFTFAAFPYFDMTEERRQSFQEIVAEISDERQEEFYDWHCLEDMPEYDILDDIEVACCHVGRETATMRAYTENGEPYELNLTGGMSWGDAPTDVYEAFCRASHFDEVYDLATKYAVEYAKEYGAV